MFYGTGATHDALLSLRNAKVGLVTQPQLLFKFLVVTLDDPAVFGESHKRLQRRPDR